MEATFPLKLPEAIHQRLRILSAEQNKTIRELIIAAIEKTYKVKAA